MYYMFNEQSIMDYSENYVMSSIWQYKQLNTMNLGFKDTLRILLIISYKEYTHIILTKSKSDAPHPIINSALG